MSESGKTRASRTTAPRTPAPRTAAARKPAGKPSAADSFNQICSVRIELLHTNPLIWRELEVPTSVTLRVLHDIIQIAVGWFDSHLWEFRIGRQTYGPPIDDDWGDVLGADAGKVRLRDVLKPRRTTIDYLYDFGDSWAHRLTVTRVRPGEAGVSYPRYVGGEWAGPPEDCGGISGFYDTLNALADPEAEDHEEITDWLDGYDPKQIDRFWIEIAFSRIANRRNAAGTRIAKQTA